MVRAVQSQISPASSSLERVPLPYGPLHVASSFYVERPPLETLAYQEVQKPGSLLRLKAPRNMGKSSLLLRLSECAQMQHYATCTIDLLQADASQLHHVDRFLRWICCHLHAQLTQPGKPLRSPDDYWDTEIGSKLSCTLYLEHVLTQLDRPLVLILNEVNQIFPHAETAAEFLTLLRSWYEQARRSPIWMNLRLVMAYATDAYVPLHLDQSPFNVGHQLSLPEFTLAQVQELVQRYHEQYPQHVPPGLPPDRCAADWAGLVYDQVGGHPYLVHLAIADLMNHPQIPATRRLDDAQSLGGIYADHLRHCQHEIAAQPSLIAAIQDLLQYPLGVCLPSQAAYQLANLGLVTIEGTQCRFAAKLYRRYFQTEFKQAIGTISARLHHLETENDQLRGLALTDGLTQIPNRRAFDQRLAEEWQVMRRYASPLTVMLCDIDHFKRYNDTYGHPQGDECLRLVAHILRQNVRRPIDFVARYGGEEFVVIMPQASQVDVYSRAEQLRSQVKRLTAEATIPGVTLSLGLASVVPTLGMTPRWLIAAADQALYLAKHQGRDQVAVAPNC